MEASVTQHKIGIASSPQNPALILFYTRGTSGLRKRVMPVRGLLEQGVEPAARRLITAHAQYLEAVDLEQVIALCTRLHAKLSVSRCSPAAPEKSENAAPQKSCTPKELDRSFLHDIAMDMGLSPDLEQRPATDGSWDAEDAEDAALPGFARGRLQEAADAADTADAGHAAPSAAARALAANRDALAAFAGGGLSSRGPAQLLQIGDEPSPCESSPDGSHASEASEERRRRPTSVTAATSRAAEADRGAGGAGGAGGAPSIAATGDTPAKGGKAKGGKAKGGKGGRKCGRK